MLRRALTQQVFRSQALLGGASRSSAAGLHSTTASSSQVLVGGRTGAGSLAAGRWGCPTLLGSLAWWLLACLPLLWPPCPWLHIAWPARQPPRAPQRR
jgi:hypothetical protein